MDEAVRVRVRRESGVMLGGNGFVVWRTLLELYSEWRLLEIRDSEPHHEAMCACIHSSTTKLNTLSGLC